MAAPLLPRPSGMVNSRLPLEVCEHIIDECYEELPLCRFFESPMRLYCTWLCTALVCSDWLPRTRYNLFHDVVMHSDSKLLHTLSSSPHLATLVIQVIVLSYNHQLCASYSRLLDRKLLTNRIHVALRLQPEGFPALSRRHINIIFYPFRTSLTRLSVTLHMHSSSSFFLLIYTLPLLQELYLDCDSDHTVPRIRDNVMHMLHNRPCPFKNLTGLEIQVCRISRI